MPPKLFSFTHFTKNASANPLVSHTFKTKDLKPFRFIHFQKGGGVGGLRDWQLFAEDQNPRANLDRAKTPLLALNFLRRVCALDGAPTASGWPAARRNTWIRFKSLCRTVLPSRCLAASLRRRLPGRFRRAWPTKPW